MEEKKPVTTEESQCVESTASVVWGERVEEASDNQGEPAFVKNTASVVTADLKIA